MNADMSEHNPGEPFCDCESCRAMTPYQIRGAWQTTKEVGLEWMREANALEIERTAEKARAEKVEKEIARVREKHKLEEKLRGYEAHERSISEALNSGDGSYHP